MIRPNWIDLLMVGFLVTFVYFNRKNGVIYEGFQLLGTYLATLITIHYYVAFADYARKEFFVPPSVNEIFAFIIIALLITLIFSVIRIGWFKILAVEIPVRVDQWGGIFLSLIRSYLVGSLVVLAIIISGNNIVSQYAKVSWSRDLMAIPTINLYKSSYEGFITKVSNQEKINEKIFKLVGLDQEAPSETTPF